MGDRENETAVEHNTGNNIGGQLNTDSRNEQYPQATDNDLNQNSAANTPDGRPPNGKNAFKIGQSSQKKDYDLPLKKIGKGMNKSHSRTGRNQSTTIGGSNKRMRGMAGVGNSIIHGTGFINIYSNPVINFGRATSRGVKQRKWKKTQPDLLPDINNNGLE